MQNKNECHLSSDLWETIVIRLWGQPDSGSWLPKPNSSLSSTDLWYLLNKNLATVDSWMTVTVGWVKDIAVNWPADELWQPMEDAYAQHDNNNNSMNSKHVFGGEHHCCIVHQNVFLTSDWFSHWFSNIGTVIHYCDGLLTVKAAGVGGKGCGTWESEGREETRTPWEDESWSGKTSFWWPGVWTAES